MDNRTCLAIRATDGLVFAVEKLTPSRLLVPSANPRIQTIDLHVGVVLISLFKWKIYI
jgi:20S proteasome subunit alpha 7